VGQPHHLVEQVGRDPLEFQQRSGLVWRKVATCHTRSRARQPASERQAASGGWRPAMITRVSAGKHRKELLTQPDLHRRYGLEGASSQVENCPSSAPRPTKRRTRSRSGARRDSRLHDVVDPSPPTGDFGSNGTGSGWAPLDRSLAWRAASECVKVGCAAGERKTPGIG
jgi:hypothetical protein